jgi:nucleotide-binding universal stress UspA family protein
MKRFKNILYVLGIEPDASCALARAVELARANQAKLAALVVADKLPADRMLNGMKLTTDTLQQALVDDAERRLCALLDTVGADDETEVKVAVGTPFLEVIREVLSNGRDLVIKCAETTGMVGRLFGSDDMHLLRKCPCPVWLCKPNADSRYRRILVAVDAEHFYPRDELRTRHALNLTLLELAAALAQADGAELDIAYVWSALGESVMRSTSLPAPEEQINAYVSSERQRHSRALESLLAELETIMNARGESVPEPTRHLPKGSARSELPTLAGRIHADLVILGTLGRIGVPGLFIGNTAEAVLHQVDCSVLAVKPPGFVSPVAC